MKGCIIKNREISIRKIFDGIKNADKYHWLITDMECYPMDAQIAKTLDKDYCWITGKELLTLLQKEEFQWIWGVFSAFPIELELAEILNYNLPYADGYEEFWKNPVSIQHPLAKLEIVAWDGSIIIVIAEENEMIKTVMKANVDAIDLECYNME
ncbi:hypothetical protein [[Clostridium] polysaccharolyticum]|jgi:hypothetical protein|uniref:Uncharacterized protein n=1 Tax=[Clostridium] polysaccharolyticum TaxID=29364 RepID=A0A1I0DHU3_9FIRM|nr:hypothetical protein [[Clostridium] polysaccharolyticum]SET31224.1 hypothetical protein SAMN04487772_11458 [[Clostridium] polysaccharolyticum]